MFLISIIIPVYNRAGLIGRCVESVIAQTYSEWELILVDDGSTDSIKSTIGSFADPRIHYVHQHNAGAAMARNNGVSRAKGEYIIFLDSDDTVQPNWLSTLISVLDKKQDVVTCGFKRFNSLGDLIEEKTANSGHALQKRYGIFLAGTYLIKRSLFLEIGMFDTVLKSGHHTDVAIRVIQLMDAGKIAVARVEQSLLNIHDHAGEKIRSNWNAIYQGSERILQKHFEFMRTSDLPWLQSYYVVLARAAHALKSRKPAIHYGWKAVTTSPFTVKNWIRFGRYLFT